MVYNSTWWEIDTFSNFEIEESAECTSFIGEVGVLQISSYKKTEGIVTREDLADFWKNDTEDLSPRKYESGNLKGLEGEGDILGQYWKKWLLSSGSVLIFATYNCGSSHDTTRELASINTMINSLRVRI